MAENRLGRELESREKTARRKAWVRPELLPVPNPIDGYKFHWVRVATRGVDDAINVSSKLREGWEPVKASDHPELQLAGSRTEEYKDNVVVGGLMLCKAPEEMPKERNAYYANESNVQMKSVDNNFMRENDPRMPLFAERKSKVTFGTGS
jgi:hypothetical protein